MEEKSKIVIFERKELVLIIFFIASVSLTTFTLGVKLGKSYSFKRDGVTEEDLKAVELKSVEEEANEKIIRHKFDIDKKRQDESLASKEKIKITAEEMNKIHEKVHPGTVYVASKHKAAVDALVEELMASKLPPVAHVTDASELAAKKLKDEFQNLDLSSKTLDDEEMKMVVDSSKETPPARASASTSNVTATKIAPAGHSEYSGKYTIQLGSFHTQDDAIKFADGIRVRGYNPIINEVKIEGKGAWYRVGLGLFTTSEEAKTYIQQEESLFQGQDYVITQLE